MSEIAPTTESVAPASSAPAPGSETTPGTQAPADTFAGERETLTTRARTEQARADRAEAQLRELQAASSKPDPAKDVTTPATSVDPRALVQEALAEFRRSEGLRTTAESLKGEFGYAEASIFENAESYDSVEALRAAAEASHTRVSEIVNREVESRSEALQREIGEKYGLNLAPPAPRTDDTPAGDPTPEALASMSLAELAELDDEVVARVLRSS